MSLLGVLRKMIGLKALGVLYNSLLGFGMIIVIDVLKWEGQWPNSKQVLAMLTILLRKPLFFIIHLRCFYNSLFSLRVKKLLYLVIELMNSFLENKAQDNAQILRISSNISMSIC